ncbi:DUF4129 domain-containing protein [Nocardia sp. NEAU-G5]|uniref:DUF4129 domain-containing protein n=1 Tax=Nocardia albiluteola TaxID=2842303 RepID=A0ABS6AT10_9NOCA|nr:DUF4129 domain-containing protein [Nocardia albiluteola]MBU3060676.1 DUF4129 domain-containing protein [Nocardia albiluteola]
MIGVGSAIPRAIASIALLVFAVVALRGYIPGGGRPLGVSPPSLVTVALMPVLCLVSIVILLAGVITSQHRLPLALPDSGRERARDRQPIRLSRLGLYVVLALAGIALVVALILVVYLLTGGHAAPPSQHAAAQPSTAAPASRTPQPTPAPSVEPHLTGAALFVAGVAAGGLFMVAVVGLAVVTVGTRRRGAAPGGDTPSVTADPAVSLAQVAEMGLAAMMASGRDARTAIIACYVAMESGLAVAREVAPLISDTPSEVLARAFDRGALHDASARELVTLFEEARFSPHSMLEWQRMRAEQLLRIVLRDLQGEQA